MACGLPASIMSARPDRLRNRFLFSMPISFNSALPRLGSLLAAAALALAPLVSVAQDNTAGTDAAQPAAVSSSPSGLTMVGQLSTVPAPDLPIKAWLTLDVNSGQIIAAQNPHEKVEPASLTKLMTAFLVFDALENNRLSLDQAVHVSEKAWRTEGSRMFIKPNTQVTVDELLRGMIVQSGNDATVALAEAIGGSEEAFVALMNEEAARQGLLNTNFENASGLPGETHLTTAYDLAMLSKNLIETFPQYLHYYSEKEYTYNDIKQNNRNRLLWTDATVDGLKTGHTKSAGYCLVTTAIRDGRRVVSVVVGASSDAARSENSLKLLNWSFQNFDTIKLFDDETPVVTARVWEGEAETVGLGSLTPMWVTVPRGKGPDVQPVAKYTQPLIAPLTQGSLVGAVSLSLDGKVLREDALHVLDDVPEAGLFGRLIDKVRMMFE